MKTFQIIKNPGERKCLFSGKLTFMADIHNRKTISYNMSMIRSRDIKPKIIARRFIVGGVLY